MKTKGLLVYIYRCNTFGDCTANGISSKQDRLILVGDGIPEIFDGDETDTVKLIKRNICGREYLHVEPITIKPDNSVSAMYGGNFIYSCDNRFPSNYPIPIHDRYESFEAYKGLSI